MRSRSSLLAALVLVLLVGSACSDGSASNAGSGGGAGRAEGQASGDEAQHPPEVLPPPGGESAVTKHPELVGSTEAEMRARFGPPTRTSSFEIGDGVSEFQIELLNHHPLSDPASADVEIHEWQWDWDGHTLALWFHEDAGRWVVVETSHFSEGVEF